MRRKERRRARLKVAVVGATAAGKSALLARLLHGRFVVLHKPTDGCYRHDSAVRRKSSPDRKALLAAVATIVQAKESM